MKLKFEENKDGLLQYYILEEVRKFENILLFGAGKSGDYFLKVLLENNINPTCYCDNFKDKQGKERNGLPIYSFETAIAKYPKAAICITSVFSQVIYQQIINYNNKLKKQVFNVMNTMNWETDSFTTISREKEWIQKHENQFIETLNLLEDDKSKKTLEGILNFRISRDVKYLMNIVSTKCAYFDEDLFPIESRYKYRNFVDGGSFTGDTLQQYIFFMGEFKYESVYCFEPDEMAVNILKDNIKTNQFKNVIVRKTALWSVVNTINFYESGAGGSSVYNNQGKKLEIMAEDLDNLNIEKIDFIKLDIEGAEYNALLGMRKTILKNKPVLAICVYHKQDDLIKIPQLIKSFDSEYKLYLRQYLYTPFDTILYAIKGV